MNSGELQTKESGLRQLVLNACLKGYIGATGKASEALTAADIIMVCVQTPLDKQGNSKLSFLKNACEEIAQVLKKEKLIIIQSTVPPKTVDTLVVPMLEKRSGLKCGKGFWLTYCPERMAPGTGLTDLAVNTRLIGAYDSESATLAGELFQHITEGRLLITRYF